MKWPRVALLGLLIWVAGTAAVRWQGHRLLEANRPGRTTALYLVSFVLMAFLVPALCRWLHLARDAWPAAATLLIFPTLLLDPFSCLFFSSVFPNIDPGAAGIFGGWMLICCGGGVAGAWYSP